MDNNSTIIKDIEEIISKYYNKSDDCVTHMRYDKEENEFWIEKELEEYFTNNNIENEVQVIDVYSSCSYEVSILCIAYHDESNKLQLYTKKLELH